MPTFRKVLLNCFAALAAGGAPAVAQDVRASFWSLRGRVLRITAFALVASLLSGGAVMYWAATVRENQMLDARLEQLGATVLSFAEEELTEVDAAGAMKYHQLKTRPAAALLYSYQVWSREGDVLLRSHEASMTTPFMPISRFGFDTVQINGDVHRVFSLPTKNQELVIQVAENVDERWVHVGLATIYYMASLLAPFGLVFVATWRMLRRSLSSIDSIADQLSHRNPHDLTPPIVERPPDELRPVLVSLDALFKRIGRALSVERQFTSVAAHELRTPLAGLRAQAQIAGHAVSPAEWKGALEGMLRGVDRASHMLDQLLDLARIDNLPAGVELRLERVDLADVCRDVMADLGPACALKEIDVHVTFEAAHVLGHKFAVYLIVRNLVANAILYTPFGGRIEVSSRGDARTTVVLVDDSGPGIPEKDREHVFERFNRLGQTAATGAGLGLSIVLSAVELLKAKVKLLDAPMGGLRVQVTFARTPKGPGSNGEQPAPAPAPVRMRAPG